MIFYFSGTGNSLYVAQNLHENESGELIDLTDAMNESRFKYKVKDDEKVGFVFPVHFFGLPTIVSDFVSQLTIEGNSNPFAYTVITCGGSIGNADKLLGKQLKKRNLQLNSSFSIKMPKNYVMMYDVLDKEEQNLALQNAEEQIEKIVELLKDNKKGTFVFDRGPAILALILTPFSHRLSGIRRKTGNFYTTDKCTSCGLCEEICPSKVINIVSGRPEWIKEKCSHCTACINRCPEQAIQYGNSTEKRGRYVNPNVEFNNI